MRNSGGNFGYIKSGHDLFYSPEIPVFKNMLVKYIYPTFFAADVARKKLIENTDYGATATVLSNEIWSGSPFSGGITFEEFALRIKKVVPDAKILIVIRRQEENIFFIRNGTYRIPCN